MWRILSSTSAVLCVLQNCTAQNWVSVGLPTDVIDWGNYSMNDSADTLYCSGINQILPGQAGLFRTTNGVWDTIGYFGSVVFSTVLYHDTLVAGGAFHTVNGDSIRSCAFFDGSSWQPFGQIEGSISKLRLLDDTLYAVGTFDHIDGQPADGIAKRIGGHWEPVGDFGDVPDPYLFDVIKYHGDLICCGNMDIVGQDYRDVYIYQNGEWGPLGGGLFGTASGGWEMTIYNDELILGGGFYLSAGNAGQCIMRWNGEIWQPLGAGTTDNTDSYSSAPNIHALCVHDGKLFVGGGFWHAGHVPAQGVAVWDGDVWCGLGAPLPNGVYDLEFYNDTLVAMCVGNTVDGQFNSGVVRYLHTTYDDTCSVSTLGMSELPHANATAFVANDQLMVNGLADGPSPYSMADLTGRRILHGKLLCAGGRCQPIALGGIAEGAYLLQLPARAAIRFVVRE